MYYRRKVTEDLFNIGGNDRRLTRFENMFSLPEGVSYNAFVLLDDKTVLFDGIDSAIADLYHEALRTVLDGRQLDYFVVHHVEPDHCATINQVLRDHPETKLLISDKGLGLIKQFYPEAEGMGIYYDAITQTIKDGDTLDCGKHKLQFISAPNVHWPEVMMTFDQTDGILFSADAFGSFTSINGHLFADQIDTYAHWINEARRYYMNIVGRQGASVQKVLKKVADLDIRYICTLHGLCFRTPETIADIVGKYQIWSAYQPEKQGVAIVYSSMYGDNMLVADALAAMLSDRGVKHIRVHDVSESDVGVIISDLFAASNAVIFGMNYNTELYPKMDALLRELKMLNYSNRHISYIGAMSWGGRGLAIAQEILNSCKNIETVGEPLTIRSAMGQNQLEDLHKLADAIAADILEA